MAKLPYRSPRRKLETRSGRPLRTRQAQTDSLSLGERRLVRHSYDHPEDSQGSRLLSEVSPRGLPARHLRATAQRSQVFIGTSNKGLFIVTTPEDVDTTLGFYTWRIGAELRHARSLRALSKRTKLFKGHKSTIPENKDRAVIYLDESGTPNVADADQPCSSVAVVIESRKDLAGLEQRFRNAFTTIRRPLDHELKTSGLSAAKHARVP